MPNSNPYANGPPRLNSSSQAPTAGDARRSTASPKMGAHRFPPPTTSVTENNQIAAMQFQYMHMGRGQRAPLLSTGGTGKTLTAFPQTSTPFDVTLRPGVPARRSPSLPQTTFPRTVNPPSGASPATSSFAPLMMTVDPASTTSWPGSASKDAARPTPDFWTMSYTAETSQAPPSTAPSPENPNLQSAALSTVVEVPDDPASHPVRDTWKGWTPQQNSTLKPSPTQTFHVQTTPWPIVARPVGNQNRSPKVMSPFSPSQPAPTTSLKSDTQSLRIPQIANSPSLSPMGDIVNATRILKKHGYVQMANVIEEDIEKGSLGKGDVILGAANKGGDDRKINSQFLSAARRLPTKENPLANYRNFVKLYSSFWQWSVRAVDSVRQCLREISFVIFIELWCRLLSLSLKKAAAFLKKFGEGHYVQHPREISELRRVESIAVLRDVPFVSRILRGERFHLKADNLTKKLLTTRLTLDNDTVILDILQKRLNWETPSETGNETALAVLASSYLKTAATRDTGSAIITPSLALLCGLPPSWPRDFGLKPQKFGMTATADEPESKVLPANLPSLYRLPRVEDHDKPAIDWRAKRTEQERISNYLGRARLDDGALPSIMALEISPVHIPQPFAAPRSTTSHLGIGAIAVSRFDNATSLGLTDETSNTIWVWDLTHAAWKEASNLYKRKIFKPWLFAYAEHRHKNAPSDKSDLEPAGVTFEFDGESHTITAQNIDETYAALSMSENTEMNSDVFADMLGCSGLVDLPYSPACLSGHQDPVTAISFLSPFLSGSSAKLALSAGYDGKMVLWETTQRFPIFSYCSGSAILDVDSERFGYLFLTGHTDRAACLWCMERRNPLRVLNRHSSSVEKVSFHPNSILVATAAADERVRLWDPRIPDIVGLICGLRFPRCLEFAPNGRYLAMSGCSSSRVQVWDLVAGKLIASLVLDSSKEEASATSLSFSQGSNLLAVTTTKGTVQVWDLSKPASRLNKRKGVCEAEAMDLNTYYENEARAQHQYCNGCVLEYSFQNCWAKKVSFTERNCLLCVNEVVQVYR